mmetsp:Transcript_76660/g.216935  ORF Transcript_76660/g.216935 Transcript_76660/m.216935 type:complete len:210 (-) Transcript_76660:1338-1967(-)
MAICRSALFVWLAATNSDPCLNDTASAPRTGATSAVQTSACSVVSPVGGKMKGIEPAAASPQKTVEDHLHGGLRTGRNVSGKVGESSSPVFTCQWCSIDWPGGRRTTPVVSSNSISQEEEFVSNNRGLRVITWHWAPRTSSAAMSSACTQYTNDPLPVLQGSTHQLGGIRKARGWAPFCAGCITSSQFSSVHSAGSNVMPWSRGNGQPL